MPEPKSVGWLCLRHYHRRNATVILYTLDRVCHMFSAPFKFPKNEISADLSAFVADEHAWASNKALGFLLFFEAKMAVVI